MKYSDKKTKRLLIATSAVTLGMLAGGFAVLGGEKVAAETPKIPDGCEISVQDGTSLKLDAVILAANAAASANEVILLHVCS